MEKKQIAVITEQPSDLTHLLRTVPNIKVQFIKPDEILNYNLDHYYALCILGGTEEKPLMLGAYERIRVEEQIEKGTKVFCEYAASISQICFEQPESTRYHRLIYAADNLHIEGIEQMEIFEDQCNERVKPRYANSQATPLLIYKKHINAHRVSEFSEDELKNISNWALWYEKTNLLVCVFRLCNFNRARFAPLDKWRALVKHILQWLTEEAVDLELLEKPYYHKRYDLSADFEAQISSCIANAVEWFENADILVDNGKQGAEEGLATEIFATGEQKIFKNIRNDCTGETSLLFFMDYLLNRNPVSLEISDNLISFCFNALQVKEGLFKGMMRWTETEWGVCYADDAARVIYPQLLKCLYNGSTEYLEEIKDALMFLVNTTGTDGTRRFRTEMNQLNEEKIKELASKPGEFPSAHYNSYYLGSLLLCYKLTGVERFKEVGVKGLETIMAAYPNTRRVHSETQEICRLILPLAWMYWVTGEEKHKEFLYRVTEDLQRFKHPTGGYLEWDTGYTASCKNNDEGECSLLAKNGDPVVDHLYSMNWLPMAFIQAYLVTGDTYFKELWMETAKFVSGTQIHSNNKLIDGAWARSFDVEIMEVFGIPNDIGWGPWAVESGWTVAEIAAGLAAGLISEDLKKFY